MAHDPSLGFADYFSAADAAAASLMPAMDEGAPELYGLQSGMELLGMRGLHAAAMSGATSVSADVHCDGGGDGHDGSTMRFFLEQQQQQHHQHHQPSQAPLSLSPCRPEEVAQLHQQQHHHHLQQQQHEASAAAWMMPHEHDAATYAHGHGAARPLRSSRFLLPAQQLLQGYCSLPVDITPKRAKPAQTQQQEDGAGGEASSSSTSGWTPSPQIQAMEALELKRLKDRLYVMLEEVDRRYRRYCEQMRGLAGGFEAVAGERAASGYTAVAARTISRHFRSLRDGIVAQLQAVRKALGEKDVSPPGMTRGDTPRLKVLDQCIRQQKAMHQNGGMMMDSHPWRPQRGLPERAVTILRAWLFEHFLNPYPSDVDKHILARQTGLSRSQVSNWFINARVRLWKPMVEEMYVEEMKGEQQDDGGLINPNNPSSSGSHASDAQGQQQGAAAADEGERVGGADDRKPTRAQLHVGHDAGSLASVVNIAGVPARMESFGVMDAAHPLDFDAYGGQGQGFGGGVSLTLGLQQHDTHGGGGVNIAFGAPSSAQHGAGGFLFPGEQMDGVGLHPSGGHGQNIQFGMDGAAEGSSHGVQDQHYRGMSAGFHLLRDLAG
ncbi:homeobox protein BEL1 homolog [Triticum dicoccoides]|uniref:homeobox protein BEL1 homolog n=1 Tax=Triticum dicoccoides TaxID=85692 RepID=UPI000E7A6990|nr:homeobox protein BEL1 homolog [Triticum dicoccoides]XP_037437185.1 homeobox protein BEL1 homolog [Triticum dicoccoides]XP_037437186.1 homeobox protein BEL1 homolog [Triticum dicoccoides]